MRTIAAILSFLAVTLGITSAQTVAGVPSNVSRPGPDDYMYRNPFYQCVSNFYVSSTKGNDRTGNGSQARPWATIQRANDVGRRPGDCVNVDRGLYSTTGITLNSGGNAPTPSGYVVYRCQVLDQCLVQASASVSGSLVSIRSTANAGPNATGGNFIVIDGFDLDGNNFNAQTACVDSTDDNEGRGLAGHHIWVINDIIHGCGLSGIEIGNKEWYFLIHNRVYNNSGTSGFQGSGISVFCVECIEASGGSPPCYAGSTYVPSGMDNEYHVVVAYNDIFFNQITNKAIPCGQHTDGNGIIFDSFLWETQARTCMKGAGCLTYAFPYPSAIIGNASYVNGGRGVHLFGANNVLIANNSMYGNGTDTCIDAFYLPELSVTNAVNTTVINNLAQTIVTAKNNGAGCVAGKFCGFNNAVLATQDVPWWPNDNNHYHNNLWLGSNSNSCRATVCIGSAYEAVPGVIDSTNVLTDPKYRDPAPLYPSPGRNDLSLQSSSPAIGYSDWAQRITPPWMVDAGACSHLFTSCP